MVAHKVTTYINYSFIFRNVKLEFMRSSKFYFITPIRLYSIGSKYFFIESANQA